MDDNMMKNLRKTMENLKPFEDEVRTERGEWFKMRTLPCRTTDNRIDGAVFTFSSIDEQKKGSLLIRRVFDINPNPLAVLDKRGRTVIANRSFGELFKTDHDRIEGKDVVELDNGVMAKSGRLKGKLKDAVEKGRGFEMHAIEMEIGETKKTGG